MPRIYPDVELPEIELHRSTGEWSALYVNGNLAVVGDHYLCDEMIHKMFGVKVVDEDAFMRGQDNKADEVAKTLDEVREYTDARDRRASEAERLRAQAKDLIDKAKELENTPISPGTSW